MHFISYVYKWSFSITPPPKGLDLNANIFPTNRIGFKLKNSLPMEIWFESS